MLPDVDAEDRRCAMHQRIFTVRRLGDLELAALDRQPGPARAELAGAGSGKIGLEFLEPAEVLVDLLFDPARQFAAAAIGLHPLPEMDVVVVLARIVEERGVLAERALDDLLQGLALEFGPLQQVVAVGHIGLVMLVVVKFQRFLRHMRREGVVGIGKVGEREGHWGHVRKEWDTMANGNLYRRFLGRKKLNSTGPAWAQRVAIANRCAIALNRTSHGDEAFMGG